MNPEDLTKQIENQLFSWSDWDQRDSFAFIFINCKLLVPMLGFSVGTEFSHIVMDYEKSQIMFYKEPEDEFPVKTGTLRLSVTE